MTQVASHECGEDFGYSKTVNTNGHVERRRSLVICTRRCIADRDITGSPHYSVYRRRWWIIFAFSLCSAVQSVHWNTWSPVVNSVRIALNWSASFVAMFPAVANAAVVLFGFPVMYLVELKGLKYGTHLIAYLVIFTVLFWNLALPLKQNWLIVFGAVFNGIAATITSAASPILSVVWFPLHERTTATALAVGSGYAGVGIAFLSSPYFVGGVNITHFEPSEKEIYIPEKIQGIFNGVQNIIYFDTVIALLALFCVLLYYPDKPPQPPTVSASVEREDFWHGVNDLFRDSSFQLLNLAFNITNGTYNSWLLFISLSFRSFSVSESTAGWLGFASTVAGCVGSIFLSVFADRFKRKMKSFLQVMSVGSILGFAFLLGIQEHYIPVSAYYIEVVLYVLCMYLGVCINGVIPLYYELGCEIAYPVHEGLSACFLNVVNNAFGMFYFLIFLSPRFTTDTRWMTCMALASCILSLPLLTLLKETYGRLNIERTEETRSPDTFIHGEVKLL